MRSRSWCPSGPDDAYQLTAQLARAAWGPGTRAAIAASPSNPTGTCLDPAEWTALAAVCRERDGVLIADEIYQGLVYDGPAQTVLAVADDVWVVNSFSKYFQMTGWRLGWRVVPEGCTREIEKVAQNLYISAPTPAQYAALAALAPAGLAVVEARRAELGARRDVLLDELPKIGFAVRARPHGAFYIYCDVSGIHRRQLRVRRVAARDDGRGPDARPRLWGCGPRTASAHRLHAAGRAAARGGGAHRGGPGRAAVTQLRWWTVTSGAVGTRGAAG